MSEVNIGQQTAMDFVKEQFADWEAEQSRVAGENHGQLVGSGGGSGRGAQEGLVQDDDDVGKLALSLKDTRLDRCLSSLGNVSSAHLLANQGLSKVRED